VAQEYQEAFGEHAYDEHGQYIGTTEFEPETEAQAAWADLAAEYSTSDRPPVAQDEPAAEAPADEEAPAAEAPPAEAPPAEASEEPPAAPAQEPPSA
jgi:small subunit ribosomal protein S1